MAVPDTDTFSLQDVVNEINPTTDDLQDCINDAIASKYDPTYYTAPATSLLEFRNYGAATLTSFFIDYGGAYGDANTACFFGNSEPLREFWHNGTGTYPIIGNTVYQDSGGLYPMSPQNWYYIPGENSAFGINNSGVVTGKVSC